MPSRLIPAPHPVQLQLHAVQLAVEELVRQLAPGRRRRLEAQAAQRQLAEVSDRLGQLQALLRC